MMQS